MYKKLGCKDSNLEWRCQKPQCYRLHHTPILNFMEDKQPKVGDIVVLKPRFDISGPVGLIIDVHKAEMLGAGGWTTFDYVVLTASGSIVHISDSTIQEILT